LYCGGPGGGAAGAYGSAAPAGAAGGGGGGGGAVPPPPPPEQLAILTARFPALRALLPAGLATLRLCRLASGQAGAEPDLACRPPSVARRGAGGAGGAGDAAGGQPAAGADQGDGEGAGAPADDLPAWEAAVAAAARARGVRAGEPGLHVGRHFSLRDLVKWCRRLQARAPPAACHPLGRTLRALTSQRRPQRAGGSRMLSADLRHCSVLVPM